MRICFSVSVFPARSQTFVTSQVLYALRAGHEVTVACERSEDDDFLEAADREVLKQARLIRWPSVETPLHRLLPGSTRDRLRERNMRETWRREVRADVVIAHFGSRGAKVAAAQQGWAGRPPLVTIFHGRDVSVEARRNGLAYYGELFAEGDLLLTVNRRFADDLVEGGAPAERVKAHHLGVPVHRYEFSPRPVGRPLRLASVCRLVEKKGLDVALAALKLFSDRYPQIEWRYEIGGDGPERARLEAIVAEAGLGERVSFLGPLSHGASLDLIREADCLLLPSVTAPDGDMEGIPVTLMEAMALGTTVCTTRHSGIPELVTHGETGLLSDEGDASGLFDNLASMVTGQVDAVTLARSARAKIERDFHEDTQNALLLDLCRQLAGRAGREEQSADAG